MQKSNVTNHPWNKRPLWQKRILGFLTYQVASWFSLVNPEAVDKAMHITLNEQFGQPR